MRLLTFPAAVAPLLGLTLAQNIDDWQWTFYGDEVCNSLLANGVGSGYQACTNIPGRGSTGYEWISDYAAYRMVSARRMASCYGSITSETCLSPWIPSGQPTDLRCIGSIRRPRLHGRERRSEPYRAV